MFFLNRFSVCLNLLVLLFLVTLCLIVAVKSWIEWIPINNRNYLLHLSLTLEFSIFSEAYINAVEHLWSSFHCENSVIVDACLGSKYASAFWRLLTRFLSLKYVISVISKSVISLKYFCSFNSLNMLSNI